MACIIAPMAEAIMVSVAKKIIKQRKKALLTKESTGKDALDHIISPKIDWLRKLGWLNNMLWGGVTLLTLEHIWYGELSLCPPFLTAMKNPNDMFAMLQEIVMVGIPMAICVTMVWGVMVLVLEYKIKNGSVKVSKEKERI